MESGRDRPPRRPGLPAAPDPARGGGGAGVPDPDGGPRGEAPGRGGGEVTVCLDQSEARCLRGPQRTNEQPPPSRYPNLVVKRNHIECNILKIHIDKLRRAGRSPVFVNQVYLEPQGWGEGEASEAGPRQCKKRAYLYSEI